MNPFTESTVARPLADPSIPSPAAESPWPAPSAASSRARPCAGPPSRSDPYIGPKIAGSPANKRTACLVSDTGIVAPVAGVPVMHKRRRRPFFGLTLGAMGLAAGLGAAFPGFARTVDINIATQSQLEAVRGIGPKTAQIIIQERLRGGQYESFSDLSDRVKGIGPKKAASLQASGLILGKGDSPPLEMPVTSQPPASSSSVKPMAGPAASSSSKSSTGLVKPSLQSSILRSSRQRP